MTPAIGYYSLVQFCPDAARLESVNVGVLLFVPETGFLEVKLSKDHKRMRFLADPEGYDCKSMDLFRSGMTVRVDRVRGSTRTVEDLNRFISLQANDFRITPPRWTAVTDAPTDLERLYERLVAIRTGTELPLNPVERLRKQIDEWNLWDRVIRKVPILVPDFERKVLIPFGYRNGRFHLIQPVRFDLEGMSGFSLASRLALEGVSLYEYPDEQLGKLQLTVVGTFASPKDRQSGVVQRMLKKHRVEFIDESESEALMSEIRSNARPHSQPWAT